MSLYSVLPVRLQNMLVSSEGNRRMKKRYFNSRFFHWATLLNDSAQWSSKSLEEYRLSKLEEYLVKAFLYSDFWEQEMKKVCINPLKCIKRDPESFLKSLPKIDKQLVLHNKRAFLNRKQGNKDYEMVHTSGTTGAGFRFPWSNDALAAEFAFIWFRRYHGVTFGSKYGTFNGNKIVPFEQVSPPFWRFNKPMNQTLFSIFHFREDYLPHYLKELKNGKYEFITGYPSAISVISNYILSAGEEIQLKAVFPSSESLYEWQRKSIEKAFNCKVYDSYTNAEQSVLIYQCSEGSYHNAYEYSYAEFEPLNNSQEGSIAHIVGTSFLNDSIFLIRYKTDDFVEINDRPCSCGRPGAFIKRIIGRRDDIIYTKDKRPIGRLDHIFKDAEDLAGAQIIQKEYGKLVIKYVLNGKHFDSKRRIESEIKARLGASTEVIFEEVQHLEQDPSGKIRGVISFVGGDFDGYN